MKHRWLSLVATALAMDLFAPIASAQKPAPPAPQPPSKPSQPATSPTWGSQPTQPVESEDMVQFLRGRIATNDGTALPNDASVQRICNNRVRQQVYATSHGDFSMEIGSRTDSFVDASGDPGSQETAAKKGVTEGIPRSELMNCELRASAGGFRSSSLSLIGLTPSSRAIDVGPIVVERAIKVKGATVSATPYKAPPNARKAYEKGIEAGKSGKLAEARTYFRQAVEIYPAYASAWLQLGWVFEKENEKDSARAAYNQAARSDPRFLAPWLSLAAMAYREKSWTEVLQLTSYVIEREPLYRDDATGYVLDLDEGNPAEAYFYNAVANYALGRIEAAEKSAATAERVDLRSGFPRLRLLLAELYARKKNYIGAISELRTYLELAPHAKDREQVQEQLAELEKLNTSAQSSEKPIHN